MNDRESLKAKQRRRAAWLRQWFEDEARLDSLISADLDKWAAVSHAQFVLAAQWHLAAVQQGIVLTRVRLPNVA